MGKQPPIALCGRCSEVYPTHCKCKTYQVTWGMEFSATSPEDAARQALEVQRDPESIATVFDVTNLEDISDPVQIDLQEIDELIDVN